MKKKKNHEITTDKNSALKVAIALASLHYKANYMVTWLDESMCVPLTS